MSELEIRPPEGGGGLPAMLIDGEDWEAASRDGTASGAQVMPAPTLTQPMQRQALSPKHSGEVAPARPDSFDLIDTGSQQGGRKHTV